MMLVLVQSQANGLKRNAQIRIAEFVPNAHLNINLINGRV
jgi:hypothetical protein